MRRTSMYASFLGMAGALHLGIFQQSAQQVFLSNLLGFSGLQKKMVNESKRQSVNASTGQRVNASTCQRVNVSMGLRVKNFL